MPCTKDGKGKMGAEEEKNLVYYSEEEELLLRKMRHGKGKPKAAYTSSVTPHTVVAYGLIYL